MERAGPARPCVLRAQLEACRPARPLSGTPSQSATQSTVNSSMALRGLNASLSEDSQCQASKCHPAFTTAFHAALKQGQVIISMARDFAAPPARPAMLSWVEITTQCRQLTAWTDTERWGNTPVKHIFSDSRCPCQMTNTQMQTLWPISAN